MEENKMDKSTSELLKIIADYSGNFNGAFNIRSNCASLGRKSSENIKIETKADNPGLDIHVKAGTKGEECFIPACITKPGIDDLVYNDFYVGEDADITIIAGCGIHTETGEPARHSGIHRFFLGKNSKVLYIEKHIGTGSENTKKFIDPQTEVYLEDGAYLEMDTCQLGGVDKSIRKTGGELKGKSTLVIRERLLTDKDETADTDFKIELNGEGSSVNLMSRSVAKGNSHQRYKSMIVGNTKCYGHSECDAILSENGKVDAMPELTANSQEPRVQRKASCYRLLAISYPLIFTYAVLEQVRPLGASPQDRP